MSSTGWITVSGASGGGGWSNAGNAISEDGAEAQSDQYSQNPGFVSTTVLDLTAHSFVTIGNNDTITGVEVQAKVRSTGGPCTVKAYLMTNQTANGNTKAMGSPGGALGWLSAGSGSDTWGATWDTATQKLKQHIAIFAEPASSGGGSPGNLFVDSVQYRMTYLAQTANPFGFTPATNQPLNTLITSDVILINGLEAGISVNAFASGGELSKNGGAWTSLATTAQNGDRFQLRHTTSGAYGGQVNTTLNVNNVTGTFTSTTVAADTTPDAFTLNDVNSAERSTGYISNQIRVTGINSPTAWSLTGSGQVSVNGGPFNQTSGTVNNNDTLQIATSSSGAFSTNVQNTLNVGGVSDTWDVTTRGPDTVPDQFTFVDVSSSPVSTVQTSNAVPILGVEAAVTLIVFSTSGTGTNHEYSKNGGAWTPIATPLASLALNDTLQVRMTSPAGVNQTGNLTVTLGGSTTDTFSVTTSEPSAFTFGSVNNANPFQLYTSAPQTPVVTAGRAITVVGGEYSLNGGAWTSGAGTFNIGDSVRVRGVSKGAGQTATVSLTINGVTGTYTINSGRGGGLSTDF